jgi:type 1 glutamine amidotransferase
MQRLLIPALVMLSAAGPAAAGPAILIFTRANGYKHDSIPAATAALTAIARQEGWEATVSDDPGVFDPEGLKRYAAVVWNNTSGTVLDARQAEAFRRYVEGGGGFVGVHGAGGDPAYAWPWYVQILIGAQFIAHPGPPYSPQFQTARLKVEDRSQPASRGLPKAWSRTDEWYSFAASPRGKVRVLVSLDEGSYRPIGYNGKDIRMGDHPIVWQHCVGRGRAFFSAMGHRPEAYAEPAYRELLKGALEWAVGKGGERCS